MALILESEELDRLADEIAKVTGEPIQEVVKAALSERLERLRPRAPSQRAKDLLEIAREFAALPDIDQRTPDEIVGYDETGMWH